MRYPQLGLYRARTACFLLAITNFDGSLSAVG